MNWSESCANQSIQPFSLLILHQNSWHSSEESTISLIFITAFLKVLQLSLLLIKPEHSVPGLFHQCLVQLHLVMTNNIPLSLSQQPESIFLVEFVISTHLLVNMIHGQSENVKKDGIFCNVVLTMLLYLYDCVVNSAGDVYLIGSKGSLIAPQPTSVRYLWPAILTIRVMWSKTEWYSLFSRS